MKIDTELIPITASTSNDWEFMRDAVNDVIHSESLGLIEMVTRDVAENIMIKMENVNEIHRTLIIKKNFDKISLVNGNLYFVYESITFGLKNTLVTKNVVIIMHNTTFSTIKFY